MISIAAMPKPDRDMATRLHAIDAGIGLHALVSDCAELGVAIPCGVRAASPADLLALVCAHPRSVSWF